MFPYLTLVTYLWCTPKDTLIYLEGRRETKGNGLYVFNRVSSSPVVCESYELIHDP